MGSDHVSEKALGGHIDNEDGNHLHTDGVDYDRTLDPDGDDGAPFTATDCTDRN